MKFKYLNDIENGSKIEMLAYVFDSEGFYCGVSRRQPDPKNPGMFLMPGNSVSVKPVLKEGYRPKWNGQAWDLVAKVLNEEVLVNRELIEQERAQKLFDHTVENCLSVVKPEVLKNVSLLVDSRLSDFSDRFLNLQDDLFNHVKSVCDDSRDQTIAQNSLLFDQARHDIGLMINNAVDAQIKIHGDIEKIKTDCLLYLAEIQGQMSKPSFWERVRSMFQSQPVVEKLPSSDDTTTQG